MPTLIPVDQAIHTPPCLVCGAQTKPRFAKPFGTEAVTYYECHACQHLTADAFESMEIYGETDYFQSTDTGWSDRNKRIVAFLFFLAKMPGITLPRTSKVLDFGCGIGQLVDDLREAGYRACGYEPYPNTLLQIPQVYADWSELQRANTRPDLITCIEVLEHIRRPDEVLRQMGELLAPSGYLLLSTGIYDRQRRGPEWYYLSPQAGHVSIFSEQSLLALMKRHGFQLVFRVNREVWLLRKAPSRSWLERFYVFISQARLTLNIHVPW